MTKRAVFWLSISLATFTVSPGHALEKVDFSREVLPVLSNKCFACHGPDAKKKELRLDTREAATSDRGGYRGIDPENLDESEVLLRIHDADDPMPPMDAEKQLTPEERQLLDTWVRQGGEYAAHWAFVPPKKAETHSTVDGFVRHRLQAHGADFSPEADRPTLARRLALTLTGLPPEPQVLAAFLAEEDSEDAYAALVETLLASPRFGEHQARYWLDAVRYGDTHGLHLDNRRGIYPYRDWVVRAFNENLPFDQFITWQVAGDLLPDPTLAQLVATGYVRMNPTTSEGGVLPEEFQAKNNFDRTETLGTVFLGMTMSCARCHTHKYDPIKQSEYYELLAFFNSTAENPLDGNKYDYGPVINAPADQAAWGEWQTLESEARELVKESGRDWRAALMALAAEGEPSAEALKARLEGLEAQATTTLVARELDKARETKLLARGEYQSPTGEVLEPAVPSVMGAWTEAMPRDRLGLARWLTSRENPLVARVLINRVWQRVFGEGLVRTPEDFGVQGEHPTHPDLLDWLAVEWQDRGWDLKHMIRLMVHSRAFKQDSARRADLSDPPNRLLGRGPSYRLDAEVLRDVALWASHLLDPHMGGEGVKPYQPAGMWLAMAHPASNTKKYERDPVELLYRRSLYVYWKRTSPHPMMTLFDAPSRESSCVRRSRSSTSLQSLALLNETQRVETARKLAERLVKGRDTASQRLEMLFRLLACRPPSPPESAACLSLLETMSERYEQDAAAAEGLLDTGEAPRDASLTAAEVAAWTQVAITVLASDLTLLMY